MKQLLWLAVAWLAGALGASAASAVEVLYSFPESPWQMARAADGNFYGYLGADAADVAAQAPPIRTKIFQLTPAGGYTVLHYFEQSAGVAGQPGPDDRPVGPILTAPDGSLYGAIALGGAHGYGALFRLTPDGTYERLYEFTATESIVPFAMTAAGDFYGLRIDRVGYGSDAICKLSSGGELTLLHSFAPAGRAYQRFPDAASAAEPRGVKNILLASDGTIYGVTLLGGDGWNQGREYFSYGTFFSLKPDGSFSVLQSGEYYFHTAQICNLAEAADGTIYGFGASSSVVNSGGGAPKEIFSYTPAGGYQTVRRFDQHTTGELGQWLLGADGKSYVAVEFPFVDNPYGDYGGVNIASVDPAGTDAVLRSFPNSFNVTTQLTTQTSVDWVLDGQDGYLYVIARTVVPIVAHAWTWSEEESSASTRAMTMSPVRYRTRSTMARVRANMAAPNRIAAATDRVMLPLGQTSVTINVAGNDLVKAGAQLQLEIVSAPLHGSVEILPSSGKMPPRLRYTAAESAPQDAFSYRISDATGATAVGRVLVYTGPVGAYHGAVSSSADGTTLGSVSLAAGSLGKFSGNIVVNKLLLHISQGRFDANNTWSGSFAIGGALEQVVLTRQAGGVISGELTGTVNAGFTASRR